MEEFVSSSPTNVDIGTDVKVLGIGAQPDMLSTWKQKNQQEQQRRRPWEQ